LIGGLIITVSAHTTEPEASMQHLVEPIDRRPREAARQHFVGKPLRMASALAFAVSLGLLLIGTDSLAQDAPPSFDPASVDQKTTPASATDIAAFDAGKEAGVVLDLMDQGDFPGVYARFDEKMSAGLSAEQLQQAWSTLPQRVGAAKGRGEAIVENKDGGYRVASIPLHYEHAELVAMIAFDAERRIAAFGIKPGTAQHAEGQHAAGNNAAAPSRYVAPPLPTGAKYSEHDAMVGVAETGLSATLAMPKGKGPFPAVVLVHGSGPHDRDETIGPNRPFLDIARGLADRGIAVLRYEKRSKARPQDYANGVTVDSETTDDAVLAIAALRKQAKIDPKRIFVLGHSQGAMMAPRIATRSAEKGHDVAGLVLLAAPSRRLMDIIIEQTRRNAVLDDGKTSAEESAAIAETTRRVAAVRRGGDVAPTDSPLGAPVAYWRSIEAVDPIAEARALTMPMLILQGGNDIQVVDADWQGWKAAFHATPRVTFKLYETLNHLAIPGTGSLSEYQTPGNVDTGLIADVAVWIGKQRKR
jgi:uncharacterized protein